VVRDVEEHEVYKGVVETGQAHLTKVMYEREALIDKPL
jgi:hypothetical protein